MRALFFLIAIIRFMMMGVLGFWDVVLLVVVTLQATVHAYVPDAQWKAFIYLLPFPFTAAALALNRPIDTTNIWALLLLLFYTHGVRLLHINLRMPIRATIAVMLLGCAVLGLILAPALTFLQNHYSFPLVFWPSCAGILALSLVIQRAMPTRDEPAQRTPAPLWMKLPTIAVIIICLILMKKHLGGFITAFPMVGVIAAYEARGSLWTMSRQVSVLLPALAAMMITVQLAQSTLHWTLPAAIAAGWVIYMPLIFLCTPVLRARLLTRQERAACEAMPPAD
jgi:hypothetical protein